MIAYSATTSGVINYSQANTWPTTTSSCFDWNGTSCTTYPSTIAYANTNATGYTTNIIQFQTFDSPYVQYINYGNSYYQPQRTAAERLREILDSRMAPRILSSCKSLGFAKDIREVRARETLRRVLGDDKYKDFVRRGSVSVRAKSGLVYQIFPGSDFTKVYDRGMMIDRLCVVLQGGFPPTDSLIMRYLMILNNEQQFRSYAIKHGAGIETVAAQSDGRSLAEIFKELKRVA